MTHNTERDDSEGESNDIEINLESGDIEIANPNRNGDVLSAEALETVRRASEELALNLRTGGLIGEGIPQSDIDRVARAADRVTRAAERVVVPPPLRGRNRVEINIDDPNPSFADHNPPPRAWVMGEVVIIEPFSSLEGAERSNDNTTRHNNIVEDRTTLQHDLCPGTLVEDMYATGDTEGYFATVGEVTDDNGARWYTYTTSPDYVYFEWMLQTINELDAADMEICRVVGGRCPPRLEDGSAWTIQPYATQEDLLVHATGSIRGAGISVTHTSEELPGSCVRDMFSENPVQAVMHVDDDGGWFLTATSGISWVYHPWMLQWARLGRNVVPDEREDMSTFRYTVDGDIIAGDAVQVRGSGRPIRASGQSMPLRGRDAERERSDSEGLLDDRYRRELAGTWTGGFKQHKPQNMWKIAREKEDNKPYLTENITGFILMGARMEEGSFERRAFGLLKEQPKKVPEGNILLRLYSNGSWEFI